MLTDLIDALYRQFASYRERLPRSVAWIFTAEMYLAPLFALLVALTVSWDVGLFLFCISVPGLLLWTGRGHAYVRRRRHRVVGPHVLERTGETTTLHDGTDGASRHVMWACQYCEWEGNPDSKFLNTGITGDCDGIPWEESEELAYRERVDD